MGYCSIDDLKKIIDVSELKRLADDSGSAEGLEDPAVAAVIAEATEQADSEIDSYLATRYTLPLAIVPRVISSLSARMTIYYLSLRTGTEPDKKWESVYKRSVEVLAQIAKGMVSLGIPLVKADSTERPRPCMVGINSTFSRTKVF